MKRPHLSTIFLVIAFSALPANAKPTLIETPFLAAEVQAGTLPSVGLRVPTEMDVVDLKQQGKTPGRHGGKLNLLMGKQKDS